MWQVIEGDFRERLAMMGAESVDHTITDPPYDKATHDGARTGASADVLPGIDFDPVDDDVMFAHDLIRVAQRWVIACCATEQIAAYRNAARSYPGGHAWVRAGFWHKPDAMPQMTGDRPAVPGESIAIMHRPGRKRWNGGGMPAFWSVPIERRDRAHPTQKPIALMLKLIEQFTDPGDLVFDPFCGSGTTGVACLRLGRRFLGIELDPKYAAIARERLAAEERGLSLVAARAGQESLFT